MVGGRRTSRCKSCSARSAAGTLSLAKALLTFTPVPATDVVSKTLSHPRLQGKRISRSSALRSADGEDRYAHSAASPDPYTTKTNASARTCQPVRVQHQIEPPRQSEDGQPCVATTLKPNVRIRPVLHASDDYIGPAIRAPDRPFGARSHSRIISGLTARDNLLCVPFRVMATKWPPGKLLVAAGLRHRRRPVR
jgi:hypothetical protein